MPRDSDWVSSVSPFHAGETRIQDRTGKRARIEHVGRRFIRPFLLPQHREFYAQLPFIVAGAVDDDGQAWASLLFGEPGFVSSPTDEEIAIAPSHHPDDPVGLLLTPGRALGLLGIELHTRRRNRVNGRILARSDTHLHMSVRESFGNCPRYIHPRTLGLADGGPSHRPARRTAALDAADRALICKADTFFVSSQARDDTGRQGHVDVSHRGGPAGFVRVDGNRLTVPDYAGNNFFNTLGNFLTNPVAGLVFVDFETGDMLCLTGRVDLLWEDDERVLSLPGAERGWQVEVTGTVRLEGGCPLRLSAQA